MPSSYAIKTYGDQRAFPQTTFDEVWDASLAVSIQQGIVARASKNSGTIAVVPNVQTPPFIVLVEESNPTTAYLYWMEYLHRRVDDSSKVDGTILADTTKSKIAEKYFDKVATQVYAESKWKYLNK